MAEFTFGEKITAGKLNEVANSLPELSKYDIWNDSCSYSRYMSKNGYFRLAMHAYTGVPINGGTTHKVTISKMENGIWVDIDEWEHVYQAGNSGGGNTWYVINYGGAGYYSGYYRNDSDAWWNVHSSGDFFCWPYHNDCVKGDFLVYYSGGNPVSGRKLTTTVLNSGMVGTRPNL